MKQGHLLTNSDAVGPSNMPSSSAVNGSLGIIRVRIGTSKRIMIGKPMAAGRIQKLSAVRLKVKFTDHHTNGLGDCHSRTEGSELHGHKEEDS